jgi:hypothetical protein
MMKLEYLCTMKLLPLFPIGLAAMMCVIYSPAYTIVVMTLAAIIALLTARAVGQSQYNKRSFTSLMTGAREEEVNVERVKRWISAMHAFALVLLLGIIGAEIALWDSPGRGIALPFPRLYAFLGGKRATNVLLDTVARKDKKFAVDAAIILIEMGKEDEIVQLKENAVPTLFALLYYTGDINWAHTLHYYQPTLDDGTIRAKAARMLARIGHLAKPALARALIGGDDVVRALAAAA